MVLRWFKTVFVVILGVQKFVKMSPINHFKTCYYWPIIICPGNANADTNALAIDGVTPLAAALEQALLRQLPQTSQTPPDPQQTRAKQKAFKGSLFWFFPGFPKFFLAITRDY